MSIIILVTIVVLSSIAYLNTYDGDNSQINPPLIALIISSNDTYIVNLSVLEINYHGTVSLSEQVNNPLINVWLNVTNIQYTLYTESNNSVNHTIMNGYLDDRVNDNITWINYHDADNNDLLTTDDSIFINRTLLQGYLYPIKLVLKYNGTLNGKYNNNVNAMIAYYYIPERYKMGMIL